MNFEIKTLGELSRQCLAEEIANFNQLCGYVRDFNYSRISDKRDLSLVLKEKRGTCSDKHAFLAAVAQENGRDDIKLMTGIFPLSTVYSGKLVPVLKAGGISYVPEAHAYLKYEGKIYDFTRKENTPADIFGKFDAEREADPYELYISKNEFHKDYIKEHLDDFPGKSFDDIWRIREACIETLSR
ncbi:MAG: hypothetical protein ACLFQU_12585 [Candidatus Kapaibacterium sp.]